MVWIIKPSIHKPETSPNTTKRVLMFPELKKTDNIKIDDVEAY